jgi:microcystin-dependent protein
MASEPYIGGVFIFAGNFAPSGYQLCAGQLLPINQYAALFAILGTTYGGNGTTNFALPDLRGRTAVGAGQGPGLSNVVLGEQGGAQNVTLLQSNMPSHTHAAVVTINCAADGRGTDNPVGGVPDSGSGANVFGAAPDGSTMNAGMATATIGTAGSSIPFSVLNPFLGINYIIAIQGLFPSRN